MTSPITNETPSWLLAKRLIGNPTLPQEALKLTFEGIIYGFEESIQISFGDTIKEKVWNHVKGDHLKKLHHTMITLFQEKVLGLFTKKSIKEMLKEHEKTGQLTNEVDCTLLRIAFASAKPLIEKAVIKKTSSIVDDVVLSVVKAFHKENIHCVPIIPDHKQT